jgi:hypothetical protein
LVRLAAGLPVLFMELAVLEALRTVSLETVVVAADSVPVALVVPLMVATPMAAAAELAFRVAHLAAPLAAEVGGL